MLTDEKLVKLSKEGDKNAFSELVLRHQDRIYSSVSRFCGNEEDAKDITQRTFINAFRKIQNFKEESAFFSWIYRIALNQAVSFKRNSRNNTTSIYSKDDELRAELSCEYDHAKSLEAKETKEKVQKALDLLSEKDRAIIILRDFDGASYADIAKILDVSDGTVRSRLHHARTRLRGKLEALIGKDVLV